MNICELDIDEYVVGKVYFFTWNPKWGICYTKAQQQDKWDNMIMQLRFMHQCMYYYCIVPEISDTGRLHCHGWFIIKDKIKWLKSVLPRLSRLGKFRMNEQKKRGQGHYYYKKDLDIIGNFIEQYKIVLSHYTTEYIIQRMRQDVILQNKKKTNEPIDLRTWFEVIE